MDDENERDSSMKLRGYDLLMTIRKAGMKPTHIALYLYPVKLIRPSNVFYDQALCTENEASNLADYELTGLRGLDVCLVGKRKDDRLRNATKDLLKIASSLVVTSAEHDGVNIWRGGKWA